jgi:hypothetical protein
MAITITQLWPPSPVTVEQLRYQKDQYEKLMQQNNQGWSYYYMEYQECKTKYQQTGNSPEQRKELVNKMKDAKEKCKAYKANEDDLKLAIEGVNIQLAGFNQPIFPDFEPQLR